MAATPIWKVYNPQKQYVAACKHVEDAAAIVNLYGAGAQIRCGHNRIVWHEGNETQLSGESYDYVAATCEARK